MTVVMLVSGNPLLSLPGEGILIVRPDKTRQDAEWRENRVGEGGCQRGKLPWTASLPRGLRTLIGRWWYLYLDKSDC